MKLLRRMLLLLLTVLILPGASSGEARWQTKHTEAYFATSSVLRLMAEPAACEKVWSEILSILREVEQAVSVSVPESDIARFNALPGGSRMEITAVTAALILEAKAAFDETNGLYDPTVYPLIDLWGFSPRFNRGTYTLQQPYDRSYMEGQLPFPATEWIDALRPLVGFDSIVLTETDGHWYLEKRTPDVETDSGTFSAQLDLGGIAKGYVCDRVTALLKEQGFTQGYFTCGGSSITVLGGPREDGTFELTLKKPRAGENRETHYGLVYLTDTSVSTSNDVSQCFQRDGLIYTHIIDPRTGMPVNMPVDGRQSGISGVTVVTNSAAFSDALTTALMVMGPEAASEWLQAHPGVGGVLTLFDSETAGNPVISTMPELVLTDSAYTLR